MRFQPRARRPSTRMPAADSFRHRHHYQIRGLCTWSNQTAARTQALAAFSSSTSRPVAFSTVLRISVSAPFQVWREHQALRGAVHAAGQTDADAFHFLAAARAQQMLDARDHAVHSGFWIGGRRHRFLRAEPAVDVRQRDGDLNRPQVDADNHAVVVQAKKRRTPSARQAAGGALNHPVVLHQLLHDEGHRAALQAGSPRQIGARDWLARADQVQNDPFIDVAHHLAGGDLHALVYPRPACCPLSNYSRKGALISHAGS